MSAGISKLQLLIDLKNKIKTGLDSAKNQVNKATGSMQKKLNSFKGKNVELFNAIKSEVPGASRALGFLSNPYVLATAAVLALVVALGSATKKAMEFEHEFMNIRQLNLDKSRKELDAYRMEVADTALVTGINIQKMTSGYYDLQSGLGVYGKEARKISEQVGKYAISTQADYNDSINQTVKAMKAFKLGANDVQSLLESNAKTVQVGIVTYAELAKVQTEYAGAAAKAGQGIDIANKMFAAFTSIAKNADIAANMTKTAFEGLVDPNVLKAMQAYGIKIYDNRGKMLSFDKIIKATSDKIKTMNDMKFNNFMGSVGGPEGLRALFGKLRTGADDFFKTLKAYDKSPVNLDKMYENALQDPKTAVGIVKNQFNTMFTSIGLLFLPIVTKVSNWIIGLIKYFHDLYQSSALFRDIIAGIGGVFKLSFKLAIIPIKATANILKFIGGIIGALLKNIGNLIAKIFGISGGVKGLYDRVRPYLIWIKDLFVQIGGILYDVFTLNFKGVKDKISNFKMPKIDEIKQTLKVEAGKPNPANPSVVPGGEPAGTSPNGSPATAAPAQSIRSGSQSKNITINIDSFIKDFNPSHQSINKMNKDELERWLTEMFMRVIRSAETTTAG